MHSADKATASWIMSVLLETLCSGQAAARRSLELLHNLAESPPLLDLLIRLEPALLHLGPEGVLLLTRFAGTERGFTYLRDCGFLERELAEWQATKNREYAVALEDMLSRQLTDHHDSDGSNDGHRRPHAPVPTHLYSELCRLKQGAEMLTATSHLPRLHASLVEYLAGLQRDVSHRARPVSTTSSFTAASSAGIADITTLKAAAWALAHVASRQPGLASLPDGPGGVIATLVAVAERAEVMSLRGSCVLALGVVALTPEGVAKLQAHGWHCARSGDSRRDLQCVSVALPRDAKKLFLPPPPMPFQGSWPAHLIMPSLAYTGNIERRLGSFGCSADMRTLVSKRLSALEYPSPGNPADR